MMHSMNRTLKFYERCQAPCNTTIIQVTESMQEWNSPESTKIILQSQRGKKFQNAAYYTILRVLLVFKI
jgi:hypothetical protein